MEVLRLKLEENDHLREEAIKNIQREDRKEHYDLSTGPLFRLYLIKEREKINTAAYKQ